MVCTTNFCKHLHLWFLNSSSNVQLRRNLDIYLDETCIHPSMKEGCLFILFCLYLGDTPNQDASYHILHFLGKLSMRKGAWAWFQGV
jgi:hypothetical protein